MNDLQELSMIERQMKINEIISQRNIKHKFFQELFNLLGDCIETGIDIDTYIENKKSIQTRMKWRFTDEEGNTYQVEGISSQKLAKLWTKFDCKYTGSDSIGYYLNSLILYIRNRVGYKGFNITLLK